MSTTCLSTTASIQTPGAFCRVRRSEEPNTHRRTNNNNTNNNRRPPERPGTGLGQAVRKSHKLKIAAPVLKIRFHLLHVHPSLFCSSWAENSSAGERKSSWRKSCWWTVGTFPPQMKLRLKYIKCPLYRAVGPPVNLPFLVPFRRQNSERIVCSSVFNHRINPQMNRRYL